MITSYMKRSRVRACHSVLMSTGVFLLFFAANSLPAAVPTYRPHITIKAGQATAFEDDSAEGVFIVERNGPTSDPVTVRLLIQGNATNGIDYQTIPQEIQIPAGSSATEIRVTPINDTDPEDDEIVTMGLADAPNTSTANKTLANVVIKDNDTLVQISVVNPNGAEAGPQPIVYRFSRVGSLTSQLTVRFSLNQTQIRNFADGTSNTIDFGDGSVRTITALAAPGVDFLSLPPSVTFRSGQSDVQLNVTPIDDATPEIREQVSLRIDPDRVYRVGTNSVATGFIEDNDRDLATNVPATVTITASSPQAEEDGSIDGIITVTRTGPTTLPLTIFYSINAPRTTNNPNKAINGVDFESLPGTLLIPAGDSSATITVRPITDNEREAEEKVVFKLLPAPTGAYVIQAGSDLATIRIKDSRRP